MSILAILLFFAGEVEGPALEGNPMCTFTDEEQIKLVITTLESALLNKEEMMVTACLSDRISNQDLKEVQANFTAHVAKAKDPAGKPLVYLRTFEVEVDGNNAVAKVEAFSYGNDNRIQAVHKIPFRKGEYGWAIDDAEPVNALLKQIGGIAPLQQLETPEEKDVRKIPVEAIEEGLKRVTPKVIPAEENTSPEPSTNPEPPSATTTNPDGTQ